MKIAHFTELFPKISETFILNQVIGLLESTHDVRIFADRPADEPKRHPEIEEYKLLDRTTYAHPPLSYIGAARRVVQVGIRHPNLLGEIIESIRRGKEGGRRLANLQTALETDMDAFDAYHAHFGDVGKSWDFLQTNPRFETDGPFVVSFYGIDASKVILEDAAAYDTLFAVADVVTVLSEDMKKSLTAVGCPERMLRIQPLSIDLNRFEYKSRRPVEADGFKILTVARFDEQKGLRYAVDAIANLVGEYDLTYAIAGNGPLFGAIQRRIRRHGIEDSVELLGWLDSEEVRSAMDDAHLFLLPSVTAPDGAKEGTPTVLLEAQAVGLPVVSTYHAGIPEIVADGEAGVLVPEKDVEALVSALKQLLEAPDLRAEMGRQGRQNVEQTHSIPAVVEGLEAIYSAAADEQSP